MVKCWHSRRRICQNRTNELSFNFLVPNGCQPSVHHSIIVEPSKIFILPSRESILECSLCCMTSIPMWLPLHFMQWKIMDHLPHSPGLSLQVYIDFLLIWIVLINGDSIIVLFCRLFNQCFQYWGYIASDGRMTDEMMNWRRFGGKQPWPNWGTIHAFDWRDWGWARKLQSGQLVTWPR
jgi:hypothetical protein